MKVSDKQATLGRPGQPTVWNGTGERATPGCPDQPEPKPLAEWTDGEIEAAISEISGLFAAKLALATAKMTEPDLQEHERQLNDLFDMRETLSIEQIRRDAERLKQVALVECRVIFSMGNGDKGRQPRTPEVVKVRKNERT